MSQPGKARLRPTAAHFSNTHWTVVLSARDPEGAQSREALEKLCRAYWPPLYAFIRRQGQSPHDAQDLTQAFFARLFEKDYLQAVDRQKGRFRSFLLASLKHFLSNERDRARAQKRGGAQVPIPLDFETAETHYQIEPVEHLTPEKIFERRWAMGLLERAISRLRGEYAADGKEALFHLLKSTLIEARGSVSYAELATQLKSTEAAVKMAVLRLRQRYRLALRAEISETVANPDEVEDELRQVLRAFTE